MFYTEYKTPYPVLEFILKRKVIKTRYVITNIFRYELCSI